MNKQRLFAGSLLCTLLLAGCGLSDSQTSNSFLQLPSCTGTDTVFASLQLDSLPAVFNSTVSRVIDAHLSDIGSIGTQPLQCTAATYRSLLKPSEPLKELADQLPEWGPSRTDLSEADLGPVLLEYLRVYECALLQRGQFLDLFVIDERGTIETQPNGTRLQIISRENLTEEKSRQGKIIQQELTVTRPALERTLAVIGGIDRLQPLSAELECLKRASLDLRNTLGLAAEAASCMPKIWDARGSLRDLSGY